uniref:3-beta hydroxysteroid dehydrogenase/isomerase domain-containing protein n=1 Tax=Plectus sambesii TaxID=2011161 RepID=A0A914VBM7_9BILA
MFTALKGVMFVLHVASPYPRLSPTDELTIRTADSGVFSALKAAAKAPTVKRVVITSSRLAIMGWQKINLLQSIFLHFHPMINSALIQIACSAKPMGRNDSNTWLPTPYQRREPSKPPISTNSN